MLAKVEPDNHDIINPSIYSEMVWEARKKPFRPDRGRIDWIVMRNRLAASEARNKRDVGATLESWPSASASHAERLRRAGDLP